MLRLLYIANVEVVIEDLEYYSGHLLCRKHLIYNLKQEYMSH